MKVCVCNNISEDQVKQCAQAGYSFDKFVKEFIPRGCRTCNNILIKTLTKNT